MFFYNLFRVFLWVFYICFFRRVYFLKFNRIPKKAPLIFISNHSNGLLDPVLIAALQMRPVYFWVRAIEFSGGFKSWFLKTLHAVPIYRLQDGRDKMHKNRASLQTTRELLYKRNNTVFIAPEGVCVIQKKMNRFKLGCAQLAFKMMEETNWTIDLKIQPVGVNYTYHEKFRSEVYISNGDPISVLNYKNLYLDSPVNAVNKLTEDMFSALREQMVYIEKGNEALVENLLILIRNNFPRDMFPMFSRNNALFNAEKEITEYVNSLDEDKKNNLTTQVAAYLELLTKEGASDYAVANKNNRNLFLLTIGFPLWLMGTIFGCLPHIMARTLRNKFVPFPEFSASFAFFSALIVWVVWALIIFISGSFFIGWGALIIPFFMVFSQAFAYHYEDYYNEWKVILQYRKAVDKTALENLRETILLSIAR